MRLYRICSLDTHGRTFHAFSLSCVDDVQASSEGQSICLRHPIEVWEDDRLIARHEPKGTSSAMDDR